jgi:hypothetical protein
MENNMNDATQAVAGRATRVAFSLTLFLSALTGFAQMPIFKRYYIADIPGLGWLAEFYVTYMLHYISAIAFIIIAAYLVAGHLLAGRARAKLTASGYVRTALLFFILATGSLLVFRNLPGYRYSPELIVVLNFSHLGLVVVFLATALALKLMKKKWTTPL